MTQTGSIASPWSPARWPGAPDGSDRQNGWRRLEETLARRSGPVDDGTVDDGTGAPTVEAMKDHPVTGPMLDAMFAYSPFLTDIATRDPALVSDLARRGPTPVLTDVLNEIAGPLSALDDEKALMSGLRRRRRTAAFAIAAADMARLWPVETVCANLSSLAEAAVRASVRHLLRAAARRGDITLPDPAAPEFGSGLVVLGMGKLGARELNYSSDIDLIILYDDEVVQSPRPDRIGRTFVRIARDMVRLLDDRTADGYVFRVDLRLRPDPGATPLAVNMTAAETYYSSMAQTWERAAMIKARPIAGDAEAGAAFARFLRPFVWRKSLDFAALQDIHAIKRRIHRHKGHGSIAVEGHDVKLGRGGIREIEFFAQAQQLIFGGRQPALRVMDTCSAINALADGLRLAPDAAAPLIEAYRDLRRIEHHIQMIEDRQSHKMPDTAAGVDTLAGFLGWDDTAAFRAHLTATLTRIESAYDGLFADEPDLRSDSDLAFTGADDDPDTVRQLAEMGFADPASVLSTVRSWLHGRYRSTRSDRARTLLAELAPAIVHALAATQQPDDAVLRFDQFIARLPAGVQIFSLFHANPELLTLLADILGTSSRQADHLARNPILLDSVLTPGFMESLPDFNALQNEVTGLLNTVDNYEDALNVLRRWTNDHRFRAAIHILKNLSTVESCGRYLSDVAEAALVNLQPLVVAEFERRHGTFDGAGVSIVALGKLGSRDMSIRSDLDLIVIYDVSSDTAESDGPKPLSPTVYYARLIHRIISAITAPTADGALYEVDMRLRPSGNSGPVATSLESFVRYQREAAWTWEHMVLTRARPITGEPAMRNKITDAIQGILREPRDAERLRADVASMRDRIDRQHGTENLWEVKYARGGLVDIDFIVQYLLLREGHAYPDTLVPSTTEAIDRLAAHGCLAAAVGDDLKQALSLCRRIQAYLRLVTDKEFRPATAARPQVEGLALAVDPDQKRPVDFAAAERLLEETLARSHRHFQEIVGVPGPE
ncbi:bifunctional [glutamine synthetase] adenylyltransferase/[glutamine synthetase]-adenylyl-L-tyrosine phosphorylase [Fodinicurvata sp. EGI_FJ10296]|uniref:bifunctional [glutamine synthetase] adenylyltransferase/[glutamine synthetase]-adenylyl-L-tyrosine phosphorylase n=1 Tax=Fodinicurvata sp. EGI_FJ10296 TaxID=3231908 RepID=UPI003454414D